jgi:Ca2+-binding EF-hand superfamily protein
MADAVFKKYDTNHNGKLEEAEFSKLLSEEYDYDVKQTKELVAELFKVRTVVKYLV